MKDRTTTAMPEADIKAGGTQLEQPDLGRGHDLPYSDDHGHSLEWVDLVRIGLVALACIASWFGLWRQFVSFDVVALVATLVGGYPIFREAFTNILARRMTMELSMTIALVRSWNPYWAPRDPRPLLGVRARAGRSAHPTAG